MTGVFLFPVTANTEIKVKEMIRIAIILTCLLMSFLLNYRIKMIPWRINVNNPKRFKYSVSKSGNQKKSKQMTDERITLLSTSGSISLFSTTCFVAQMAITRETSVYYSSGGPVIPLSNAVFLNNACQNVVSRKNLVWSIIATKPDAAAIKTNNGIMPFDFR